MDYCDVSKQKYEQLIFSFVVGRGQFSDQTNQLSSALRLNPSDFSEQTESSTEIEAEKV